MVEPLNRCYVRDAIEKSLKKKEGREIRVCGEPIVTEVVSGGLLSSTARVKVLYTVNGNEEILSKTFFFKMPPKSGMQSQLVQERGMFEKEALFYGRVLPMMLDSTPKNQSSPLPLCYFIKAEGENKFLVLDDLTEEGYRNPDASMISEGFDLPHCILAMKFLGRLHGLSVAAEMSQDDWLGSFLMFAKESWFYEADEGEMVCPAVKLTKKAIENLVEFSKSVDGLPTKGVHGDKLENFVKNAWKICCRMVAKDDKINVLSHGDFYANNLMFKYETDSSGKESPVDVRAIDLQLTRYCHPAIDILFFLHLCTKKSLRDDNLDNLLGAYHESFAVTLKDIRPPPFTLEELTRDVCGKYKPFGVLVGAVSVPNLMLASNGGVKEFQDIFGEACEDTVQKKLAEDPEFRSRMTELIRDVVEMVCREFMNETE